MLTVLCYFPSAFNLVNIFVKSFVLWGRWPLQIYVNGVCSKQCINWVIYIGVLLNVSEDMSMCKFLMDNRWYEIDQQVISMGVSSPNLTIMSWWGFILSYSVPCKLCPHPDVNWHFRRYCSICTPLVLTYLDIYKCDEESNLCRYHCCLMLPDLEEDE